MPASEKILYGEVVLRSSAGASLFQDSAMLSARNFGHYQAAPDVPPLTKELLEKAGFQVIAATRFGVSISGPVSLFESYFRTKVGFRRVELFYGGGRRKPMDAFVFDGFPQLPNDILKLAEAVYIPRIGYFLAGEGPMPTPSYYHLRPPADISRLTNADAAHARGFNGSGVMVGMIDSGFILNHDYYTPRGYAITVHTAVGLPNMDEVGHGTGIASNLLAIASSSDFHFFKMFDGTNWASLAAFRMAVTAGVKVITCSWGQWRDTVLEAEIQNAVANGITVIFACGNGGSVGWPGCMPEVISVGGAFPQSDGTWVASGYASSGINTIYPARHCPDLAAIVGQAPKGIFIVMPTMQGSEFDGLFSAGGIFPNGDETAVSDGWLVASGTSSAAPMVAGAAAVLLQAKSSLAPAEVKQTLQDTCRDITAGASASGETAGIGPDSATGSGMIDIGAAVDKVAPVRVCPRAPLVCVRAPIQECPRLPLVCLRAPVSCRIAPVECTRAPIVCVRAPNLCRRLPLIECVRTPVLECLRAPLAECRTAPVRRCNAAPLEQGCLAGPTREPIDPREGIRERADRQLVPVVVMMSPEEAEYVAADQESFLAETGQIGMEGEYSNFPDVRGCASGPFDPRAR
jgi:serine protease AprX